MGSKIQIFSHQLVCSRGGRGFMLRLYSIDKIGRAPRALPLPHIGFPPPEREWKERRMYTYRARTGSLRIARWRSLGLKSGPPASGLHDPDLSPFFMKHQGDQRGRHHPKTPSALEREKGGGMTTHARPNLERR